jgi:ribose 5-phosphate isomerase B
MMATPVFQKIAVGTDHAGFVFKEAVKRFLLSKSVEVVDFGTDGQEAVDYPDFVRPAAEAAARGEAEAAIVFGGSGNGEAICANKVRGIRCTLCWNLFTAEMARLHNNSNCLALGQRTISEEIALKIVEVWLTTAFEGGRHLRRIEKIES